MLTKGIYIYAIVPNLYSSEMFMTIQKSGVYAIPFKDLSAIVSNWESSLFDLSDKEAVSYLLNHHNKTIEAIMKKGFDMILPMKFRTIVHDKLDVFNILLNGHDLIINALKNIENMQEADLTVTWADFGCILNDVANHPEVIAMKNNMLKNPERISQIDQVKIGNLIHEKLDEINKELELKILNNLSPICLEIKTNDLRNDQIITKSAFLINRHNKEIFLQKINQLNVQYKNLLSLKLESPLPCYHSYTIEVKALNTDQVAQAKIGLGLKEETSESEIRKAYLEKARLFHTDSHPDSEEAENFNIIQNAFRTLIDYIAAFKQSSKDNLISLAKEKVVENLILVKIKELSELDKKPVSTSFTDNYVLNWNPFLSLAHVNLVSIKSPTNLGMAGNLRPIK